MIWRFIWRVKWPNQCGKMKNLLFSKKFCQINSLVKTLVSRNFCQKSVRVNLWNYLTVKTLLLISSLKSDFEQKFREMNFTYKVGNTGFTLKAPMCPLLSLSMQNPWWWDEKFLILSQFIWYCTWNMTNMVYELWVYHCKW